MDRLPDPLSINSVRSLLFAFLLALTGCDFDLDITKVRCTEDIHCPDTSSENKDQPWVLDPRVLSPGRTDGAGVYVLSASALRWTPPRWGPATPALRRRGLGLPR